jgi:MFS family permease
MKKQKLTIMFTTMLMFIGFGIVIPVLPHVISAELGASDFHVQMMIAVYSLVSFILSPFWGAFSERVGRKPVMVVGIVGYGFSFFLFGLFLDHLVMLYVSRILSGAFAGATIAVAMAYMADITSDEERTKGMGLIGMSIGLGFIFGPGIGGLLTIGGNYALPFYTAAGLSLLTMVFCIAFVQESLTAARKAERAAQLQAEAVKQGAQKPSRWAAFQGSARYLYVLTFLATFVLAGLEGTLQLFQMEKIGVTPAQMGSMFFLSGVAGALIQGGFIQRYMKKGDEVRYMIVGFALCGVSFVLLLFTSNLLTATIYLCIFGIGNSLIRPCVTSLITQKANVSYGLSAGLSSSFDSLARVIGPLFAGVLFAYHISWPYLVGAVFCLLAVLLVLRFKRVDAAV